MEINIHSDPKNPNLYTIKTSNNLTIRTTFAQQEEKQRLAWRSDDPIAREWVHEIKKLHRKSKNESLIVGFSADSSFRYDDASRLFVPFEIFVICVDTHCLIYVPRANVDQNCEKLKISGALRKLFSDKDTVVVGVGMENVAKRVENKYGLKKLHRKSKNESLIVGFSADSSFRYDDASRLFVPFEIFVICVDTHCLIYVPRANVDQNCEKLKISGALRKLFSDKDTVVVGVGMENVAKRVENKYGLKKLHRKSKNESLIVGFSADSSFRYDDASRLFVPFEIFVICVDTHCLIYVPRANVDQNCEKLKISGALRKLFSDKDTVVVGVGMENVAKRVENKYGLKITKPTDLRKLAALSKDQDLGSYGNHNLVRLGKAVLGEEWDLVKPKGIDLCKEEGRTLSCDKVKCVTVEALVAYEMGKKLQKIFP